jgi:hypothetical protein
MAVLSVGSFPHTPLAPVIESSRSMFVEYR